VTAPSPTDAVAAAVTATADAITAFGTELKSPFQERDLQDLLVVALAASIAEPPLGLTVKPNRGVRFAEWPGVGPVDVALIDDQGAAAAFLELKWGSGTLYNCVWDLPKMAVAVARQHSPRAYLVAGAPATEWENGDGSELFGTGEHSVAGLLVRYRKHWDFWKRDVKTHPVSLPAWIETRSVAAVEMQVRDHEWSLRGVEVSVAGSEWLDVCETSTRTGPDA
jgi:hypothetical protein